MIIHTHRCKFCRRTMPMYEEDIHYNYFLCIHTMNLVFHMLSPYLSCHVYPIVFSYLLCHVVSKVIHVIFNITKPQRKSFKWQINGWTFVFGTTFPSKIWAPTISTVEVPLVLSVSKILFYKLYYSYRTAVSLELHRFHQGVERMPHTVLNTFIFKPWNRHIALKVGTYLGSRIRLNLWENSTLMMPNVDMHQLQNLTNFKSIRNWGRCRVQVESWLNVLVD